MLELKSKITITQRPTKAFPLRNEVYIFDFIHELEIDSTWTNLADNGSMIFPRKLSFRDQYNKVVSWDGKNAVGGVSPIIVRGDKIKIELGYYYEKTKGNYVNEINTEFEGFISYVKTKTPIEIGFEDNMWLLKQIQAPNKTFKGKDYTLESMLKELLKDTEFTVKDNILDNPISTTFGDFTIKNETIAQVLERLQKDFRFESSFNGSELRCGFIVYYPDMMDEKVFKFQHNIISDDLTYKRSDDAKIGLEIHTHQKVEATKKNKDGTTKYKTTKANYFGYVDSNGNIQIDSIDKKPTAFDGDIRTINMLNMPINEIKKYIEKQLNRLSYDGFRGTFEVFGLPSVRFGNIVRLIDENLPERNGKYMVKGVKKKFGVNGFRQEINLDIKVSDYTEAELNLGL